MRAVAMTLCGVRLMPALATPQHFPLYVTLFICAATSKTVPLTGP